MKNWTKKEYNALIKDIKRLHNSLPHGCDVLVERRIRQALTRVVYLRDNVIPLVSPADAVREVPYTTGVNYTSIPPEAEE